MKFSYDWLQSFFNTKLPSPPELAELIERYAFEVESVEGEGKAVTLDIKVTPNRGSDCFSHRGIAGEIAAILSVPLKEDLLRVPITLAPQAASLAVHIEDTEGCSRYTAAVISGVTVGPSPQWLAEHLTAIGQRPINNVVDATNYVMWHLGQPLHAFDASKLRDSGGYHIGVRRAQEGEAIETLDKMKHHLSSKDILIVDGVSDAPIGIAGVKGGRAAEITAETRQIIIESACFDSRSVRQTSKRLKLRTDASVRFENGVSPELAPYALTEVVRLILSLADGTREGYVDIYPKPLSPLPSVAVTKDAIEGLLGIAITRAEIGSVLERLRLPYEDDGTNFTVTPPFERPDLRIPEDLIEEIGRMYGFDRVVPVALPKDTPASIHSTFFYLEEIRTVLESLGFSEVFTSSFRSEGEVRLANALASDKEYLRPSLIENLSEVLERNAANAPLLGLEDICVFEIGTVFDSRGEHLALGVGIWGQGNKGAARAKELFVLASTALNTKLGVVLSWKESVSVWESDISAALATLPTPAAYAPVERAPEITYKPFSLYPFIARDVALWVPNGVEASEVLACIRSAAGSLLIRVDHFDTFSKADKTSHAFRMIFQATDRTLTDGEANTATAEVHTALANKGWEIR